MRTLQDKISLAKCEQRISELERALSQLQQPGSVRASPDHDIFVRRALEQTLESWQAKAWRLSQQRRRGAAGSG